ncbi:protein of unknown function [Candidatus Nitrosocosmicus franklandus]|uniref:Transmembrane protein n=1 Tax=Candidatus Nitrosocosmicus franklandianus TaxID=1798806 RepID=A0A484I707_9ARCH|nr:protein of unknown function [Candidatus Nitrosocosmicus franklandus]
MVSDLVITNRLHLSQITNLYFTKILYIVLVIVNFMQLYNDLAYFKAQSLRYNLNQSIIYTSY